MPGMVLLFSAACVFTSQGPADGTTQGSFAGGAGFYARHGAADVGATFLPQKKQVYVLSSSLV